MARDGNDSGERGRSGAMVTRMLLLASFAVMLSAANAVADVLPAESLVVLPGELTLTGPEQRHRLLVGQARDGVFSGEVPDGVAWESSDPQVVRVEDGAVVSVSDGEATVTARVGERTATATVRVVGADRPHEWGFRNHVQSVLAKVGCNSGACHGALAGKGGFKLSLRGYDTPRDYQTITRQARGRRIELADPGRSLLLAKPSGAIPHKGGLRFDVGSLDYQVLSEWIAAGAKPPRDDDPRLERLEILPPLASLQPGDRAQLLVRAHFSDGHVEDVTQWSKFTATNEAVAKIDDTGSVSVVGHGEGAVYAWYLSQIVIARVTSRYPNQIPAEVYAESPRRNFIDAMVLDKLEKLNLPPSPRASDHEFIRRVYLDTLGRLPTPDEVRTFLDDATLEKRDRLIDTLLSRSEFADYWTYKWSDLLLVNGQRLRPKAVQTYYDWIFRSVTENKPWDELVREIVTSKGSSVENGATNFFALHQDPLEMTENTSQAFLGLSIGCARCHNHPLEKWTNDQYYAMANLFARVRAKGWGGDSRSGDGLRTLYVVSEGDLIQPLTGKPQPPTPLDGQPLEMADPSDRREYLADWLTAPENPYFSRAIANRVWGNFFGVGLVEPLDDMRASNPASNEELLDAIAQYLVDEQFDLRALMRLMLRSETYHRTSLALAENQEEQRFYSRYYPRRLMAEVLLDAVSDVTQVATTFDKLNFGGAGETAETKDYPKGTRAVQLRDSAVASYFLATFGRNERAITCECERSNEPSIVQVLHIANGDTINKKLSADGGRIANLLAGNATDEQIIDEAYLSALSRHPEVDEMQRLLAVMAEADAEGKREVVEDLFWSILSSREFLFNH